MNCVILEILWKYRLGGNWARCFEVTSYSYFHFEGGKLRQGFSRNVGIVPTYQSTWLHVPTDRFLQLRFVLRFNALTLEYSIKAFVLENGKGKDNNGVG